MAIVTTCCLNALAAGHKGHSVPVFERCCTLVSPSMLAPQPFVIL